MIIEGWLIVDGSGKLRVYNRKSVNLKWNEAAFRVRVTVASSWGKTAGIIIEPQGIELPKGERE